MPWKTRLGLMVGVIAGVMITFALQRHWAADPFYTPPRNLWLWDGLLVLGGIVALLTIAQMRRSGSAGAPIMQWGNVLGCLLVLGLGLGGLVVLLFMLAR